MANRSDTPSPSRRDQARLATAGAAGVLAVLFAVFNFDKVEVNWILSSVQTPLVVVIVVAFGLGIGVGALAMRRRG